MTQQTPIEFANEWYRTDDIARCIADAGPCKIPHDVHSREFAEWLTDQYRLAMAKGIQIGRYALDQA